MFEIINKLTRTFGPSGNEGNVAVLISEMLKGKVDEIKTDALGNLICIKKGSGKKIMLAAHMDEIGVIVSYIDDKGFLRFGGVGGINPFVILGQRVVFENGTVGVIWYEENIDNIKNIKLEKMYIDIGAKSVKEAEELVNVGDMAVFEAGTVLQNGRIISKAMDNRIGCAILIKMALNEPKTDNEIYYVFTVQEEVGLRGARTAAFGIVPDMALAVDVTTTGDTPECKPMSVSIGNGPTIKIKDRSVIAHPEIKDRLIKCAKEENIPHQFEILMQGGTDAGSIHTTAGGIPSGGVSIPTRNIHNTAEIVDMKDVENAVKLLEAFVH
ncbi:MAG: M42 family metallopeptidase [Clostridiaceae bacterium]|jgi:putative aminopeptidase FrvX|nr:M42 family metallopeptidase [Clostridiaceae bacterium]